MQMPVLKEVLDALNIPRYELAGWEADDLIGTISRKCEAADWECVVVTGDKDIGKAVFDFRTGPFFCQFQTLRAIKTLPIVVVFRALSVQRALDDFSGTVI